MKDREEVVCYQAVGGIWMPNAFPGGRVRYLGQQEWAAEEVPEDGGTGEAEPEEETAGEDPQASVRTFTTGAHQVDDINMPPREVEAARERNLLLEGRQKWPAPRAQGKKAHYWNVATFR